MVMPAPALTWRRTDPPFPFSSRNEEKQRKIHTLQPNAGQRLRQALKSAVCL